MPFGVYVHIPYCLQRCVYCDFATYEKSQILPPENYIELVKKEVQAKAKVIGPRSLSTLYFGGGTPSLLKPPLLSSLISTLAECGFETKSNTEITIEINPATVSERSLNLLLEAGFNRFSVGVQTFDENLLKLAHRKHTAQDTHNTLKLLSKYDVNFSIDILFALPTQTLEGLKEDIEKGLEYGPKHISPYCLTVPESNPMASNRPSDDNQVTMFEYLWDKLEACGFNLYEISNLAIPGFESQHNNLYWNDESYWGIGLSSHSYLKNKGGLWGTRFWNARSIKTYEEQVAQWQQHGWSTPPSNDKYTEILKKHESMTDFTHTSLRTLRGLDFESFKAKFDVSLRDLGIIKKLALSNLIEVTTTGLVLTRKGILLSNQVFEALTFEPPLTKESQYPYLGFISASH